MFLSCISCIEKIYDEVLNLPHGSLIDITDSNGIAYMCNLGITFKTPILLLLKETSNCFFLNFKFGYHKLDQGSLFRIGNQFKNNRPYHSSTY